MELNKANRQVCDVDIRILKTMQPFLDFETANTTTAGLSGDSAYAMAKGTRKIAFPNPIQGTMSIEAQVYPFKFFSLLSDGVIESSATYADKQVVTYNGAKTENGRNRLIEFTIPSDRTIVSGTVFLYPKGYFGEEKHRIKVATFLAPKEQEDGTLVQQISTPMNSITEGAEYEVGYIITRTSGVQKISFNNNKLPQDYYITQKTLDKDEEGKLTPFVMTAYKATVQRNFELSFNSEGDPATVTLTFDLMEDKNGNIFDMVELTADAS